MLLRCRRCYPDSIPRSGHVHNGGSLRSLADESDDGGKYIASKERKFSGPCKSGVLCWYREYRDGIPVCVNLPISSFSCLKAFHTIFYIYSWFIVLTQSLLTVRLAVSEIKPVQTDKQTDRIVNYSKSYSACTQGLITTQ